MKKIVLKQLQSPGDLLMLTVAIRDLHLNYPKLFQTDVFTYYPEIFYNNKYIVKLKNDDVEIIDMDYGPYLKKYRKMKFHFSDCFIEMLNEKLGLFIKKTTPKAYIKLTKEEKDRNKFLKKYNIKRPYWLINAGIKSDIPLKQYPPYYYQKIVELLYEYKQFEFDIIQTGHSHHIHPELFNVINLVGKTDNLRDYIALLYHSNGSIGPVSLHMHLSAAFNKPCVVIAGGREEYTWEKYMDHCYLNSIGNLKCCKYEGCWKSNRNECISMGERFPKCMEMIEPIKVVDSVLNNIRY